MTISHTLLAATAALALSACAAPDTTPRDSGSGVPRVAEQGCIDLVNRNNGDRSARVTSSEFSEANSLVMLTDARGTSWRCLVSNDGVVADLSVQ